MVSVGLVLGGGGVTGASFHFGTLLALEMATGWDPKTADVIVGTSCGAFVAAMIRHGQLDISTFVGDSRTQDALTERLRSKVYQRTRPKGFGRWVSSGLLPALRRRPNLSVVLGSPGLYRTDGLVEWVEDSIGDAADGWPEMPTVIVAYDLERHERAPFGTTAQPKVSIKDAVAASSAVPLIFDPVKIGTRWYADGGVASGTSADLLLAHPEPLDLVIVIAPLASPHKRRGARFYESMFDRVGRAALDAELDKIHQTWPATDVLILRPDDDVMNVTRPNPMAVKNAVPAFLTTLNAMDRELARPEVWSILSRHLVAQPTS
ncbi:MAG: patatin-like phospholipase family protein [Acidobacteria bacterium]|nr:patatin-like phospholipase family protein [Acidobacteriota bacterium]